MRILVLGAAAGGGFPQWNAADEANLRARRGDPAARPATQASIALSADGEAWILVNASPDLRQQIAAHLDLWPRKAPRHSPIAAVVLTNGDVDAVAGLLHLREGTPFALYAAPRTLAVLERNPIFEVLDRRLVPRRELPLEEPVTLRDAAGEPLGLELLAFPVPGKPPLYLEGEYGARLATDAEEGDVIGVEFRARRRRVVYVGNVARLDDPLRARLAGADVVFVDATLWRDDEMIQAGVGTKSGRRMGHVSVSGPGGVLERLGDLPAGRKVLIHINNTNPILLADSPERREVEAAGFEVAYDGMEIVP